MSNLPLGRTRSVSFIFPSHEKALKMLTNSAGRNRSGISHQDRQIILIFVCSSPPSVSFVSFAAFLAFSNFSFRLIDRALSRAVSQLEIATLSRREPRPCRRRCRRRRGVRRRNQGSIESRKYYPPRLITLQFRRNGDRGSVASALSLGRWNGSAHVR